MAVPVIALTGHLGAGKTTLLNHLLSHPGARVGVVVNDFGDIPVDAGLLAGQVDEAASIAGGCICCLDDDTALDDALERLADPRLRLDAIVVEASGAAEPLALARLIRFSGVADVPLGGVVDVADAVEHDRTVDTGALPPARYAAATLVVVSKLDRLAPEERDRRLASIADRVGRRNPAATVIASDEGRIDPALVFDGSDEEDPPDELPISALLREAHRGRGDHAHAEAVSVVAGAPVDAGALVDLLEDPPAGAYRLKGVVPVRSPRGARRYAVNLVGRTIDVRRAPDGPAEEGHVAIGPHLADDARARLEAALLPAGRPFSSGLRRLERRRRLSL
ncbi:CobW family GTP-binding protein [Microbacterium sp. gxy059]|uniref:CobW family GTP-binding protein n=1 Tax=Microbacterium sp. gxy059 TaxID=2957199 RepID=UPI003D98F5AC